MKLFLAIILFCMSSVVYSQPESKCEDKTIYLSELKAEQAIFAPFSDTHVWIYKRSKEQIESLKDIAYSKYDSKYPTWWSEKLHPTDPYISQKSIRSLNESFFVFWVNGPVFGYGVKYLPKNFTKDPSLAYIDESWPGGFVDFVNQIGYDFTGRPFLIELPEDRKKYIELAKLNLLIPKYTYNSSTQTITLLCE